jgi:hypothetical protein
MTDQEFKDWVMRNWPQNVSNQVAIQQGTFTNNSPGAGSVAWAGVVLEYKNQYYQITDGNTANPWIYWEIASPFVFANAASFPTLTVDGILIGKNTTGTFMSSWRSGQGIPAEAIFDKLIANQIDVSQLSAISADLGTITAGTVTGVLLRTGTGNPRVEINSTDGLKAINSSGQVWIQIPTDSTILYANGIRASPAAAGVIEIGNPDTGTTLIRISTGGSPTQCDIELNDSSGAIYFRNSGDAKAHIGPAGLYSYTDVKLGTAGTGVIMVNNAGTVTKRVRLNDAGDGLIFETP